METRSSGQKRSLSSRARFKNGSARHLDAKDILSRTREFVVHPDFESIQDGVTYAAEKVAVPTAKFVRRYPLAAVGGAIAVGFLSALFLRRNHRHE